MTLWTAIDAATATGGRAQGDWTTGPLAINSRAIEPGEMFVALKAARDGHDFVRAALDAGAAAALVSHIPDGCEDAPLLIVDDVQVALEALAAAGRARAKAARLVAITGSVGKTSTKDMLRHCLARQGRTHASIRSYNNHWGVPLTLANMPADTEFAAIEIGMNHPGEIGPLTDLTRPDTAIITNIGPVHLEFFDDGLGGIAREKAEILRPLGPDQSAIVPDDFPLMDWLRKAHPAPRTRLFGTAPGSDWHAQEILPGSDATVVRATSPLGDLLFRIGAPGAHFARNALAVLAAIHELGGDVALAALALADWTPPDGRGRRYAVTLHPDRAALDLIDDAYNANPASLGAALDLLAVAEVPHRARRTAILGDMKELGPTGPDMHRILADHPALDRIDAVHTVGPLMQHLHDALPADLRGHHTDDASAMTRHLREMARPGDAILVKGSLSMKMAMLVDGLRALGDTKEE